MAASASLRDCGGGQHGAATHLGSYVPEDRLDAPVVVWAVFASEGSFRT